MYSCSGERASSSYNSDVETIPTSPIVNEHVAPQEPSVVVSNRSGDLQEELVELAGDTPMIPIALDDSVESGAGQFAFEMFFMLRCTLYHFRNEQW